MKLKKVAVAMSGGVDSSVAALIMVEAGYEVFGVTMDTGYSGPGSPGGAAAEDARRIAEILGISHYVVDLREVFAEKVVDHFCDEYLRGRTPNPCVVCNQHIKFGVLLEKALQLGADLLATGHYARLQWADEHFQLLKGVDPAKDQSYFLHRLDQHQLRHSIFPLGVLTKAEVRRMAAAAGLSVVDKGESQEICFVTSSSYADFVGTRAKEALCGGEFRLANGQVAGRHEGIHHFTIGQRKGLGIAVGQPVYVTRIDPEESAVWLGRNEDLFHRALLASEVSYISGHPFKEATRVEAKIRYAAPPRLAWAIPHEGNLRVEFDEPQRAITPGQAVVFYQGERVLGGGTIEGVLEG